MCTLTNQQYLKESIEFLHEFNWLFRESNTLFLKRGVLDHLPKEWCQVLVDNSYKLPVGVDYTESLALFLSKCKKFSCRVTQNVDIGQNIGRIRGVSPKKLHEILNLTKFIRNKHKLVAECVLVDLGSGSGYVTQQLYESSQYRLLGLEANETLVTSARQRQEKYFPSSTHNVKYVQHFITDNSNDFIEKIVENEFPDSRYITLFGLHSCGDLSIAAINLFFKMSRARSLIIMPCCYHKLKFSSETGLQFKNFPLSECLHVISQGTQNFENIFTRPFLRLACQETAARWQETDHNHHGRKMFERALAEAIVGDNEQCVRSKVKQEILSDDMSFTSIEAQYNLVDKRTKTPLQWTSDHQDKCEKLLEKHPNGDKMAECLTFLQTMVQEICEQVVLKDRLCYAEERAQQLGLTVAASIVQIVNDQLSPRCYAFVLEKLCL